MITVISRPQGHKLAETVLAGVISDGGGDARITTSFTHGLTTGDWVYIQSSIADYNGYKQVFVINTTIFEFADTVDNDPQEFIQAVDVTYQVSVLEHGFIAAHNPIVYELESDLSPENTAGEAYAPATVDSHSNDNGYTKLTLSGNLEDATALAWIMINGVSYQIMTALSDSVVIINHAYDAADTFPGPVVKYYNNYCINVNVWCGYEADHPWVSVKPFEIAATLQFSPGQDNRVKFSISEIVRSYLKTRNKLDLNTLPNNTDFSVQFYIEYFESYDESDGSEITTHTEPETSDATEFTGMAINSQMPFKSKDLSFMSEYLNEGSDLAPWLTLQESMTWLTDRFMDLSFLNTLDYDIEIQSNGIPILIIPNPGPGVIRVPLEFDTAGEKCIQAMVPEIPPSEGFIMLLLAFDNVCPGGEAWTTGASPSVLLSGIQSSSNLADFMAAVPGATYNFSYSITVGGSGSPVTTVSFRFIDDDCNIVGTDSNFHSGTGAHSGSVSITPTGIATKIAIRVTNTVGSRTITLNGITYDGTDGTPAVAITEIICINVLAECTQSVIPESEYFRLLEDGDFRLLEGGDFRLLE